MKINVMCLNWNGKYLLEQMIPGLINNLSFIKDRRNIDYEIFVRDNGSSDGSIDFIKQFKINILGAKNNLASFSTGMNSLYNIASPNDNDLILFINNDIKFNNSTSLDKMLGLMEQTSAAISGARLMVTKDIVSHQGIVFSKKYGNMPWNWRFNERINPDSYINRKFQAVTAACSFIKVDNFKKAGLFNEQMKWAFEDVWLNLEVSLNQKETIVCCGDVDIIHLTSESLKKNNLHKLFMNKNVEIFKSKWLGKYKIDHEYYENDVNYNAV